MISHRHQCIFIHIHKTAGTAIEKKLGHFEELAPGVQDHRLLSELEPYSLRTLLSRARRSGWDARRLAREWRSYRHQELTPKQYQTYFKFAFVRNPWHRVFSWYCNVMEDEDHRRVESKVRTPGRRVPDDCTFKQFVIEFGSDWPLRPQLDWLRDSRGNLAMDFIGRFENLEQDFAHVGGKLGIRDQTLPKMMLREWFGEENPFDSEIADIIYERYKEEILMFGYHL
jgi:hypothetical protein